MDLRFDREGDRGRLAADDQIETLLSFDPVLIKDADWCAGALIGSYISNLLTKC